MTAGSDYGSEPADSSVVPFGGGAGAAWREEVDGAAVLAA